MNTPPHQELERVKKGWMEAEVHAVRREQALKEYYGQRIQELEKSIQHMKKTRSWRMTAWLRRLEALLRHR